MGIGVMKEAGAFGYIYIQENKLKVESALDGWAAKRASWRAGPCHLVRILLGTQKDG